MIQNSIIFLFSFFTLSTFGQINLPCHLSNEQIREDMKILYQSIDEGVIEVYWYRDSLSYKNKYDSICALEDGMPYVNFYREVTKIISSMGCLHSYVSESPLEDYFFDNHLFLPLGVNNTNNKSLVSYSYQNQLPIGSEIRSINGMSIMKIRNQMFTIYGTDGFISSIPKYGTQNDDFPYFYKHYVDTSETFEIEYASPDGLLKEITLQGAPWDSLSKMPDFETVQFNQYPFGFNIVNEIAILNIETSSLSEYNEKKWSKFLAECFRTIEDKELKHLVIDVRRNSGGWMPHMYHLIEYFCPNTFTPVTEAWQKEESYDFFKFSESPKRNFIKKKNRHLDSLIGNSQYDNWLTNAEYSPKENHFFEGKVYILTGGDTHSAASRFVSAAHVYANPVIIGDYPGGCFIGGSGGNTVNVILPNSKINVNLALTYFKPGWFDLLQKGIAVSPDYFVEQEIGKDAVMEFAMEYIKELLTSPMPQRR